MAGSIIAGLILGAGATAVAVAVTTFVVNLVLSTVLTRLLSPTPSGGGASGNVQDPGVQSRLPANPANKLGVVYGSAWVKGAVIHGENTSDYKTAYYAVALCENIGTSGYPNSMTSVYWQEFRLTLNGDGWVTGATDASGASVSSFNDSIRVQYFANGLPSSRGSLPNTTWFQTVTNTISGYSVAVITVKYNRDQRIFQLEDMTFNLTNGLTAPGTAIQDYLTNTRYGCALASSLIDTASLAALNTYSAEFVTFTPVGGGTASQPRYRFNGVVNTTDNCWNNLQNMTASCGAVIRIDNLTGRFGVFIDRPWTDYPVYAFDSTNIIGDSNVTLAELTGSPNQLEIRYARGDNQFKGALDTQLFKLPSNLVPVTAPVNQNTLTLPLCNNNIQAEVLAKLTINQYALDLGYTFRTDHRAIGIQSGDVISITDNRKGWTPKLFRVLSTAEVERQDGFVDVEIVTKEYSSDVYVPGTLIQADPSPNITVPSPRALSSITPNAPRVTGTGLDVGQRYFDLTVNLPILNGMRVDYIEVYSALITNYASYPTLDQYQLLTTIKSNAIDGSFADGEAVVQTIYGLEKGDYVYVCKLFNTVTASYISLPSLIHQWDPQNTNIQRFDTSGTWVKPQGGQTQALIQIWGGGGGGGGSNNQGSVTAQSFLEVGNYTYIVPNDVAEISVSAIGGGGRGGANTPYGAGGGGAGAQAFNQRVSVGSGEIISISVGQGANATSNATATVISSANFTITLNPGFNGFDNQSIPGDGGIAETSGTVFIGNSTSQGSSGTPGNFVGSARGGDGASSGLGLTDGISPAGGIGGLGGTFQIQGSSGKPPSVGSGAGGGGGGYLSLGGDGGSGRVTIYPYSVNTTAVTTSGNYTVGANTNSVQLTLVGGGGAGGTVSNVYYNRFTATTGVAGSVEVGVGQTYDYYFSWGYSSQGPWIVRSTQANPTVWQNEVTGLPLSYRPQRLVVSETKEEIKYVFVAGTDNNFSNTKTLYRYDFGTGQWFAEQNAPNYITHIFQGATTEEFFAISSTSPSPNAYYGKTVFITRDGGLTASSWQQVFTFDSRRAPLFGYNGQSYYFYLDTVGGNEDRTDIIPGNRITKSGNTITIPKSSFSNISFYSSFANGAFLSATAQGGAANALTKANLVITDAFASNGTAITLDYDFSLNSYSFTNGLTFRSVPPIFYSTGNGSGGTWQSVYTSANYFTSTSGATNNNIDPITNETAAASGNTIIPLVIGRSPPARWGVLRSSGNLSTWDATTIDFSFSNVVAPTQRGDLSWSGNIVSSNPTNQYDSFNPFFVYTQNGRDSIKTTTLIGRPFTTTAVANNNATSSFSSFVTSNDGGATWQLTDIYYWRKTVGGYIFHIYGLDTLPKSLISGPLAQSYGLYTGDSLVWQTQDFNGGGGGLNAETVTFVVPVIPNQTFDIVIGQQGLGNTTKSAPGGSGGNTSVTINSITYTAMGGNGGNGGQLGSNIHYLSFGAGFDSSIGAGGRLPSQPGGYGAGGAGGSLSSTVLAGGNGGSGIVYVIESGSVLGLGGGGGGGGGYLEINLPLSELNSVEDVFVGAGGAPDPSNISGGRGGNSSIRNWVATGGFGGQFDGVGGAGGTNNFYPQPDWTGGTGGNGQSSGDGDSTIKAGGGGGGGFGGGGLSIEGGTGGSGPLADGQSPGGGGAGSNPSRGAGRGGSGAVVITSY